VIIISQFSYGLFAREDRGWEPERIGDGRSMGGRSGKGGGGSSNRVGVGEIVEISNTS